MKRAVTSFGPSPIPQVPGAVQSSLIGQQSAGPRAREKNKPQEADAPRRLVVRDDVRLSDPLSAQAIDGKPDAAEEWKHNRKQREQPGDGRKLDIKA